MSDERPSWTQPLCLACWVAYDLARAAEEARDYIAEPTRAIDAEVEHCVACGGFTASGIYIRVNPEITTALRSAQEQASPRSGSEPPNSTPPDVSSPLDLEARAKEPK